MQGNQATPEGKGFKLFLCVGCKVASILSDSLRSYGAVTLQAPLSMGFCRQECWSGLSCPSPGTLPEPASLPSLALADGFLTTGATWEALKLSNRLKKPCFNLNKNLFASQTSTDFMLR